MKFPHVTIYVDAEAREMLDGIEASKSFMAHLGATSRSSLFRILIKAAHKRKKKYETGRRAERAGLKRGETLPQPKRGGPRARTKA